ncbi:MAG: DUF465 domain-containing protein [Candidatus Tectomicrobia bacterium]|uniref:DUF465 domain-containing protein n=1 Tax=Tectimicrobiota bacterium TaxID=2528274 RepID=A0A933LQ05_UNCTE|nr:DUF465 domain-containing protein [Candidatus Tectomicrobia bacterium]
MEEQDLMEKIRKEDQEFAKLWNEHKSFESKLEEYSKMRYLTTEQEIDRKRIQKMKLLGKDRMAEIIRKYKTT